MVYDEKNKTKFYAEIAAVNVKISHKYLKYM